MTTPDVESTTASPPSTTSADMDRLSLVQALKDFEVANARVLDLTQRMLDLEDALSAAERDLAVFGGIHRTRAFGYLRKVAGRRSGARR